MKLTQKLSILLFVLSIVLCIPVQSGAQTVADIHQFKQGGDEVDWSYSTGRIVYASRGPDNKYGIHTCSSTGDNDVWITKDNPHLPPGNKGSPQWDPSGRFILFVAEKPQHPGSSFAATPGLGSYSDLWIMTADGQQAWQLTDLPMSVNSGIIIPRFSHDGKKLVWAERIAPARILIPRQICAYWDLKIADFEFFGTAPKLTNVRTIRPGGREAFNESYGFTPDDRSIIFCSDFNQPTFFKSQIFTCNAETGLNVIQLTNGNYNEHACYSRDGKSIVWMTTADERRGTDWWIMNSDGSGKRQLTFFNKPGHPEYSKKKLTCGLGVFSPDGRQFLGGVQNSLLKQTGDSYMITFQ